MLHPSLAIRYRDELEKLHTGLTSEENRTEAFDVIRGLIDRVVIQPQEDGYSVTLEGDLCAIFNLAGDKDLCRFIPLSGLTMVAEERLEPPTRGLCLLAPAPRLDSKTAVLCRPGFPTSVR